MIGKAFAPGHITGFFEIRDRNRNVLKRGSRGAGVNLSSGVVTTARIVKSGNQKITIYLNGQKTRARTTLAAVKNVICNRKYDVSIYSRHKFPVGQGLGMSAAGALSAAIATSFALKLPHSFDTAAQAAHRAEIGERTGLGDIPAQTRGGWELRTREGIPPFGHIDRFIVPVMKMAICVSGGPVHTKAVLTDPEKRQIISKIGNECIGRILKTPTLETFFHLSLEFAQKTGLSSKGALSLAEKIVDEKLGLASVSMIGNSVFAIGKLERIKKVMAPLGKVYECFTDIRGAVVL